MRMIVALTLSFIAATAAADPLGPPPYAQTPLDIAANGDDYLALWADARSTLDLDPLQAAHALFDARLSAAGTPATAVGNRISPLAFNGKIAPAGSGYLLAYNDPSGLYTVRVDADGAEIGTPAKLPGFANAGPQAMATNGTNVLMLVPNWVAILTPDGALLRSAPIADMIDHSPVWVLPNGSYQFVAFRFYCTGITPCAATAVLTTVTSAGDVAETKLFDVPQGSHVAAASGHGRVLIVNESPAANGDIYVEYRLFDTNGTPLHGAVRLASRPAACCTSYVPAAGWDGREFLVVYPWPELRAARVTADGVQLDATPFVLDPAGGGAPLFATNGTTTTVMWGSGDFPSTDLVSRTVRTFDELAGVATQSVTKSFPLDRAVQLATGPTGTLVVWRKGYPNSSIAASVLGSTIAPAGSYDQQAPVAARGRDAFLVVWRTQEADSYHLLARRVSFGGFPIDDEPIVLAAETGRPMYRALPSISIASDGVNWLVVYPSTLGVLAVRVSPLGALLDRTPIRLSLPPPHFGIAASPHVVWSGTQYVALWPEDLTNPLIIVPQPPNSAIYEARITAGGQLVDTRSIANGGYIPDLALAAAPERLLAVWTDGMSLASVMLDLDGTPLFNANAITWRTPAYPPPIPDVEAAWDGAQFVTAWTVRTSLDDAHIEYVHVDRYGLPVERTPIELAPELGTKYTPALAPEPDGVSIAFHALDNTYVSRVFLTALPRLAVPPRRRAAR